MKGIFAFLAGLIAGPALFGLAAVAGRLPSSATSNPPGWEMSVGMRALDASLERRSKGLKNPIAANDRASLAAGKALYADNCSGCHGTAKASSDWGSKGFYPRAPQFWQQGSDVTPEEAYAAIHDGIRYSGMGAWRDLMKTDDMWKVANFVARIREQPGAKTAMPMRKNQAS
jgi:mono/diheme cytochrome c family protein